MSRGMRLDLEDLTGGRLAPPASVRAALQVGMSDREVMQDMLDTLGMLRTVASEGIITLDWVCRQAIEVSIARGEVILGKLPEDA